MFPGGAETDEEGMGGPGTQTAAESSGGPGGSQHPPHGVTAGRRPNVSEAEGDRGGASGDVVTVPCLDAPRRAVCRGGRRGEN